MISILRVDVVWIRERTGAAEWLGGEEGAHVVEVGVGYHAFVAELFGHVATDGGADL